MKTQQYCELNFENEKKKKKKSTFFSKDFTLNMSETNTNESKTPSAVKDFGVAEDRNKKKRRKMEDAHTLIDSFGDDENSAFFAVYDGHSGKDAAKFCSENLHKVFSLIFFYLEKQIVFFFSFLLKHIQ